MNLKQGEYWGKKLQANENSLFHLCITDYEPYKVIDKHYHDNGYVSILLNGQYVEKGSRDSHGILQGDVLLRPAGYNHQNEFRQGGGKCFNIEFKLGWQEAFETTVKLPDSFHHYKAGLFPSLYKLLVNFKNNGTEDLAFELISDWVFDLNQVSLARGTQPWLEKVISILDNELDVFHSLESLSGRVNVHRVYMARAFKERKGVTIGEYQLQVKLSRALFLLLHTDLPISDIAFRNGFYDDPHFVRSFKSMYKIAPQKFRVLVKS
ncbi:AraC family transcriptional regulator [Paraflavitalea soli]|uniref:AraC family transcriptional regulator n=1 Tax=Paraflavitalea soli TaxID=2315862 RepID=A0A3B7MTB7_9BACT|nr:helix-turn-helix domain-containing protein [Paraflavitalea soli]AXY73741.1 AraC family transcriptional regulator [Paraflavitalea soli]